MSDADRFDPVPGEPPRARNRWRGVVMLLGIVGLAIAAVASVDDVRDQALPGVAALAGAFGLQLLAMIASARAWVALFPPSADRHLLARGLYTSQLTKYLPAGGFVQAASQVTMSTADGEGLGRAAIRLPVFSLCTLVAAALWSSLLVFDTDLPGWARLLAGAALGSVALVHRRVLAAVLTATRRLVPRLPDASSLPPQRSIVRCTSFAALNLAAYGAAFAVLLGDLTDVRPLWAATAFCAAWAIGYVALPLPSGLGVREVVIVAALPGLATGSLLAASVAHRVTGLVAEATLAGVSLRPRRRTQADPVVDAEPPAG